MGYRTHEEVCNKISVTKVSTIVGRKHTHHVCWQDKGHKGKHKCYEKKCTVSWS